MKWLKAETLDSKNFTCGQCGEKISSQLGYRIDSSTSCRIYICHNCECPNVFYYEKQFPGAVYGSKVENVPENISSLYEEARNCLSVNAFTSSVMASRKLLMNISVDNGAKEGLGYIEYVNFLEENHYTPPKSKDWVGLIRKRGNEANHEIKIQKKEDAEELVNFIEMLLKFIYEFPSKSKPKKSPDLLEN